MASHTKDGKVLETAAGPGRQEVTLKERVKRVFAAVDSGTSVEDAPLATPAEAPTTPPWDGWYDVRKPGWWEKDERYAQLIATVQGLPSWCTLSLLRFAEGLAHLVKWAGARRDESAADALAHIASLCFGWRGMCQGIAEAGQVPESDGEGDDTDDHENASTNAENPTNDRASAITESSTDDVTPQPVGGDGG